MTSRITSGPSTGALELQERRKQREPIIRVWDLLVRTGHWSLVFAFAVNYLFYRKFPTHAYAGYFLILLVTMRLLWGFIGGRAARFENFVFTPRETIRYFISALRGHAGYYVSHNPMGAWMVFALLTLLLINGITGLMLYSAGQQLGPLGATVPADWEDMLIKVHQIMGHVTAACVGMHILGVLWAARAHRENYVLAMFTGYKRVPRKADLALIQGYPRYAELNIPPRLRAAERCLNYLHPFGGSLLIVILTILIVLGLADATVLLNKYLPAY